MLRDCSSNRVNTTPQGIPVVGTLYISPTVLLNIRAAAVYRHRENHEVGSISTFHLVFNSLNVNFSAGSPPRSPDKLQLVRVVTFIHPLTPRTIWVTWLNRLDDYRTWIDLLSSSPTYRFSRQKHYSMCRWKPCPVSRIWTAKERHIEPTQVEFKKKKQVRVRKRRQ